MTTSNPDQHAAPISFGDHPIKDERRERIVAHIAMLSETARGVSDGLPFGADIFDVIAELEANADDEHPGEQ